jgi:CRP-like cAMP-binding protein
MKFELSKYYYKSPDIFAQLPEPELDLLKANLKLKRIRKKKILFRQGSYPAGMYILIKGKLKLYQVTGEKESILYFYTAGDITGFRPILCNETHPLSAAALEDAQYYFISRTVFLKLLRSSPSLSNFLLESLGHEFSVWVNNMSVFSNLIVRERIALALLKLNEIYKTETSEYAVISLSRSDFASYVGTAKESLVRLLGDFKKRNIISTKGKKITILNLAALYEMLGD